MRRLHKSLLFSAILLAACGSPQDQAVEETTSTEAEAVTTTEAAPDTTAATAATSTTTSSTTTTTPTPEDGDLASVMGSLSSESAITSARIEGSIEMTGLDTATTGLSEGVILFSAAYDTTTGDNSFLMDMSSMMGSLDVDGSDPFAEMAAGMFGELEFRQIGDTAFVKFPLFTSMLGAETEWVSMPAEEGQAFAGDFETVPTDPNEVIAPFEEAGASVDVVGIEAVNGVEATHYRVSLDTEAMDLTAAEEAELAASGLVAAGVIPLDLWISEDGYLVRMIMQVDASGMELPPEEQFDTMTMRYDVFDINGDVVIEEPPASQVMPVAELEDAAFGLDD